MTRARPITPDRAFQAGTELLSNFAQDRDLLAPAGFTPGWEKDYRTDLNQMFALHKAGKDATFVTDVNLVLTSGVGREALGLARNVLALAQPAGVRGVFDIKASDLQSARGLYNALWQICTQAR